MTFASNKSYRFAQNVYVLNGTLVQVTGSENKSLFCVMPACIAEREKNDVFLFK